MRDIGFDFQWYDKYTQNLFAKRVEKGREHYDVVTAFELFEHYAEPLDEIKQLAELGDLIIFPHCFFQYLRLNRTIGGTIALLRDNISHSIRNEH